jgi:hypothetical protein
LKAERESCQITCKGKPISIIHFSTETLKARKEGMELGISGIEKEKFQT